MFNPLSETFSIRMKWGELEQKSMACSQALLNVTSSSSSLGTERSRMVRVPTSSTTSNNLFSSFGNSMLGVFFPQELNFLHGGILKMYLSQLGEVRDPRSMKFVLSLLGLIVLNKTIESLKIRYVKFLLISSLDYKVHQVAIYFLPILFVRILIELNFILNRAWS